MIDSDIIRALIICLALVGSFYCGMRFERDRLMHEMKESLEGMRSFFMKLKEVKNASALNRDCLVIITPNGGIEVIDPDEPDEQEMN